MKTSDVGISDLSYFALAAVDVSCYPWAGDVAATMRKEFGCTSSVSVVKPILQRMRKGGLLTKKQESKAEAAAHVGAPRVVYKLTATGRKALRQRMKLWGRILNAAR